MNQENKRDAAAALHRENIVRAAAALFAQKGFDASSIDDIARESGYSRRTIYTISKSNENLLCLAIAQELRTLRDGLRRTQEISGFFAQYDAICAELLGFLVHSLIVDFAGIRRRTDRDELRFFGERNFFKLVVIDKASVDIDAVVHHVKEHSRKVFGVAVGEVAAVFEAHG